MNALLVVLVAAVCCLPVSAQNYSSQTVDDYIGELNEKNIERWPDQRMPIKVFIKPGENVIGFQPQYASFLDEALQAWSQAMRGQVSFVFVNTPAAADITISWISHLPENSKELGGLTTIYPGAEGPSKVDIKLVTFPERRSQQQKLLTAVKFSTFHEIGHALGIAGHSSNPQDVMTGTVHLNNTMTFMNIGLSNRDVCTLQRIYNDPAIAQRRNEIQAVANQKREISRLGNEGNKCFNSKDYNGAKECYEKAFAIDRTHPSVRQNLAMTYYELGKQKIDESDWNEADRLITLAIEIDRQHLNGSPEDLLQRVRSMRHPVGSRR